MKESVMKKVQVLLQEARESKNRQNDTDEKMTRPDFPNSLADNIKTPEQAHAFMTLLKAL